MRGTWLGRLHIPTHLIEPKLGLLKWPEMFGWINSVAAALGMLANIIAQTETAPNKRVGRTSEA